MSCGMAALSNYSRFRCGDGDDGSPGMKIFVAFVVLVIFASLFVCWCRSNKRPRAGGCRSGRRGVVAGSPVELESWDNFQQATKGSRSVVMCYADWCGHCKKFMPTWDKLSQKWNEKQDKVQFVKVECGNAKENAAHKDIMEKYNIKGYPTIMVFENGTPSEYTKGRDEKSIESFLGL